MRMNAKGTDRYPCLIQPQKILVIARIGTVIQPADRDRGLQNATHNSPTAGRSTDRTKERTFAKEDFQS